MYSLPELNIAPHSGSGGCAPKPRKLKDAIEIAGLQLEEFFSEEGDEAEAQAEAEEINTELDRIKTLANLS